MFLGALTQMYWNHVVPMRVCRPPRRIARQTFTDFWITSVPLDNVAVDTPEPSSGTVLTAGIPRQRLGAVSILLSYKHLARISVTTAPCVGQSTTDSLMWRKSASAQHVMARVDTFQFLVAANVLENVTAVGFLVISAGTDQTIVCTVKRTRTTMHSCCKDVAWVSIAVQRGLYAVTRSHLMLNWRPNIVRVKCIWG